MSTKSSMAFAPASIGNLAVGFDVLGCAFDPKGVPLGDRVLARINEDVEQVTPENCVQIEKVLGLVTDIPSEPLKNTASRAVFELLKSQKFPFALTLEIFKGTPLSSGLGGSAASAVAAVVAANELLENPLTKEELYHFALAGEAVASGSAHGDNVAPSLMGGIQLVLPESHQMISIPSPNDIFCVVVHPEVKIETKRARSVLKSEIPLKSFVQQSGYLAGFIHGCHANDVNLIEKVFSDQIIEPQRCHMIPGFNDAKLAALNLSSLGFSISGAGPSVFAWTQDQEVGEKVAKAIQEVFASQKISSQAWVSTINSQGARIIPSK